MEPTEILTCPGCGLAVASDQMCGHLSPLCDFCCEVFHGLSPVDAARAARPWSA